MKIRAYRDEDLESVVAIFTAAVHELAVAEYDARQRSAWAPRPPDSDQWRQRLAQVQTIVAESHPAGEEDNLTLTGFLSHHESGHIEYLFTRPGFERQGVARSLYRHFEAKLVARGGTSLTTHASLVARPFFEREGFAVAEEQRVVRCGVELRRFAMWKLLS